MTDTIGGRSGPVQPRLARRRPGAEDKFCEVLLAARLLQTPVVNRPATIADCRRAEGPKVS